MQAGEKSGSELWPLFRLGACNRARAAEVRDLDHARFITGKSALRIRRARPQRSQKREGWGRATVMHRRGVYKVVFLILTRIAGQNQYITIERSLHLRPRDITEQACLVELLQGAVSAQAILVDGGRGVALKFQFSVVDIPQARVSPSPAKGPSGK